jgi:hypothetical protein
MLFFCGSVYFGQFISLLFLCGSPSPQRISALMQVNSVGTGNFTFPFFFLISCLIFFYLIRVGLKVLSQISTTQDANVVYDMCKSSFFYIFKSKNDVHFFFSYDLSRNP